MSNPLSAHDGRIIDQLFQVITQRRHTDPDQSYSAALLAAGPVKIANKLGEEAVETVTAALAQPTDRLIAESADLLYHLSVLWAATGVQPSDVWAELAGRQSKSGIEEKKSRVSDPSPEAG